MTSTRVAVEREGPTPKLDFDRPTEGFAFTATCTQCGGMLRYCNGAQHNGTESVASVTCRTCRREFYISVHLRPFPRYKDSGDYKREQRERVA